MAITIFHAVGGGRPPRQLAGGAGRRSPARTAELPGGRAAELKVPGGSPKGGGSLRAPTAKATRRAHGARRGAPVHRQGAHDLRRAWRRQQEPARPCRKAEGRASRPGGAGRRVRQKGRPRCLVRHAPAGTDCLLESRGARVRACSRTGLRAPFPGGASLNGAGAGAGPGFQGLARHGSKNGARARLPPSAAAQGTIREAPTHPCAGRGRRGGMPLARRRIAPPRR